MVTSNRAVGRRASERPFLRFNRRNRLALGPALLRI